MTTYVVVIDTVGSPGGEADNTGRSEYNRTIRVKFDAPQPDATLVFNLPECPQKFEAYPGDSNALADKVSAKQDSEDPATWDIDVHYASLSYDQQQATPNPLERAWKISSQPQKYQKIAEKGYLVDENGNAANDLTLITNSAYDVPIPAREIDATRKVLTCVKNFAAPEDWWEWQDALNGADIVIEGVTYSKWTLKCNVGLGEWQYENGTYYKTVTVTLEHRKETWVDVFLDRGFRTAKQGADKKWVQTDIVDPTTGEKPQDPKKLDGEGQLLTDQSDPQYRQYLEYEDVEDYSAFDFPTEGTRA